MNFIGFDLNATRLLAVSGPAGAPPRPLPLDGAHVELPMAVSLEARRPEVGRAGVALCRRLPHLTCTDFLAHLNEPQTWSAGRHRLDAGKALALVLERVRPAYKGSAGTVLAVPTYLKHPQVANLMAVAEKARLPVLGSVVTPLAVTLAAQSQQAWSGLAMVGDIDGHALMWTAVGFDDGQASILGERVLPHLGLRAWKNRLIDAVADRCVRLSRRDPRDSAAAEQMLYDQLGGVLDACRKGRLVDLAIEARNWYQNLVLRPEEIVEFCAFLARQAVNEAQALLAEVSMHEAPRMLLLTQEAGHLPGLPDLLQDAVGMQAQLTMPPADAPARAAHDLATRMERGDVPRGHFDVALPLVTAGRKPEAGNPGKRTTPILRSHF